MEELAGASSPEPSPLAAASHHFLATSLTTPLLATQPPTQPAFSSSPTSSPQPPPPPPLQPSLKRAPAAPVPVTLLPPPKEKRQKLETKAAATRASRDNVWWCTCMPVWPAGSGRKWHALGCPRKQFEVNGVRPTIGVRVQCMPSAGLRAGELWECRAVRKDGWVRVG